MTACEKCWNDARSRAFFLGGSTVDEYHKLLDERQDTQCSPEEQCGEVHLIYDWKDGSRHCVCGGQIFSVSDSTKEVTK